MKKLLDNHSIIGVISGYKSTLKLQGTVNDLSIANINEKLMLVGLDESIKNKNITLLSISELWKVELLSKLDEDIIIIGNMYNSLIHKERENIKRLLINLSVENNKKIILIDNRIESFINLVEKIVVINNKNIVFETEDVFDNKLYEYASMPCIIDFIKYANRDEKRIVETTDIYELIKDIYRRCS